jgi:hypothetical protein
MDDKAMMFRECLKIADLALTRRRATDKGKAILRHVLSAKSSASV